MVTLLIFILSGHYIKDAAKTQMVSPVAVTISPLHLRAYRMTNLIY